jgi:SAM-dependent methyltransferase/uncharacterized protein YbaR (Trm112 family)
MKGVILVSLTFHAARLESLSLKMSSTPLVDPEILAILRCPVTHQDLVRISDQEIASLDGSIRYPVINGIYHLLRQEALSEDRPYLREEKAKIKNYYDDSGWVKDEDGNYKDFVLNTDVGPWNSYHSSCALRLRKYLPETGRFILDAGSGPIPLDEYRTYHDGFEKRICVDISSRALEGAREKLGDKGVYILGDLTNLPIKDEIMDAAVSCHVIYHIPEDEQSKAFIELSRVLRLRGRAVVVYVWPKAPLLKPLKKLFKLIPKTPLPPGDDRNADSYYYIHPHTLEWFESQRWPFDYELIGYMIFGADFARKRIGRSWQWKLAMKVLWVTQQLMPHTTGRYGKYPMIILKR